MTIIIRGAFGRQAWSLHLRTSPYTDLDKITAVDAKGNAIIPRPLSSSIDSNVSSSNKSSGIGNHHAAARAANRLHAIKDVGDDDAGAGDSGTLKAVANANTNGGAFNDSTTATNGETSSTTSSNPKCELSIPSLRDVAEKCVGGGHLARFQKLKDEQIEFETSAMNRVNSENNNPKGKIILSLSIFLIRFFSI